MRTKPSSPTSWSPTATCCDSLTSPLHIKMGVLGAKHPEILKIADAHLGHGRVSFSSSRADATQSGLHVCAASLVAPLTSWQLGHAHVSHVPHFQAVDKKPRHADTGHCRTNLARSSAAAPCGALPAGNRICATLKLAWCSRARASAALWPASQFTAFCAAISRVMRFSTTDSSSGVLG